MSEESRDLYVNFDGRRIVLIAAADARWGLGRAGRIPWDVPEDRAFFRRQTRGAAVLMGRVTYESISSVRAGVRGFGWSACGVLTHRATEDCDGVVFGADLTLLLAHLMSRSPVVYCAGGGSVYRAMRPYATDILVSRIDGDWDCDTSFVPVCAPQWQSERSWAMTGFVVEWYRKSAASGV